MLNSRDGLDLFKCVQCDHKDLLRQRQGVGGRGHMTVEQGACVRVFVRVCVCVSEGKVTWQLIRVCGAMRVWGW